MNHRIELICFDNLQHFNPNPYFEDTKLKKTFTFSVTLFSFFHSRSSDTVDFFFFFYPIQLI
jgi:hypothetical protein